MPGQPKIYVDFNTHGPDSRFYVASMHRFDHRPALRERFLATDFEDFDGVECEIIAIDHVGGIVYHRPVDPSEVPGTFEAPAPAKESTGLDAASVREPQFA